MDSPSTFDPWHELAGDSSGDETPELASRDTDDCGTQSDALPEFFMRLAARVQRDVVEKMMLAMAEGRAGAPFRLRLATNLYTELNRLYYDEARTFPRRLLDMATVVAEYRGWVPDNVRRLQPWLKLLSRADRLKDRFGASAMLNVMDIVTEVRGLLDSDAVRSLLAKRQHEQLLSILDQSGHAFQLLDRLKTLGTGAAFSDYIRLIESDKVIGRLLPEGLISLIRLAEELKSKIEGIGNKLPLFPVGGGSVEKLIWLMQALEVPEISNLLASHLDPRWLNLIKTPQAIVQLASHYPAQESLLERLSWLVNLEKAPETAQIISGSLIPQVAGQMNRLLGGQDRLLPIIDFLMKITEPGISSFDQVKIIAATLATADNLKSVLSLTPWSAAASAGFNFYECYRHFSSNDSWWETAVSFVREATGFAKNNLDFIKSTTGVNLAGALTLADFLQALPEIQQAWSWEQTVTWLGEQAKKNPLANWYCDRFLEVSLIWQLYRALTQNPRQKPGIGEERKALHRMIGALRTYLPDGGAASLDIICRLWPLFPGLIALRQEGKNLPVANSWISWLNALVELAQTSQNPDIRILATQVEEFAADFGTHAILGMFDGLSGMVTNLGVDLPHLNLAGNPASAGVAGDRAVPDESVLTGATVSSASGNALAALSALSASLSDQLSAGVAYMSMRMPASTDQLGMVFPGFPYVLLEGEPDENSVTDGAARDGNILTTGESPNATSIPVVEKSHQQIIWGDEQWRYEKSVFSVALTTYWIFTGWALCKVLSAGNSACYMDKADKADKACHVIEMPQFSEIPDGEARLNEALVEADLDGSTPQSVASPRVVAVRGAADFLKKYRGGLATGTAVMVGTGLTTWFVRKYYGENTDIDISGLIENVELVDITELSGFKELLVVNGTHGTRNRRAMIESADPAEKVRAYMDTLHGKLVNSFTMGVFFKDFTERLIPKILKKVGLLKNLDNDFALLLELDVMCMKIQRKIILSVQKFEDYTDFKALFMINRMRNFIMSVLLEKYAKKVHEYYAVVVQQPDFQDLNEFWRKKMLGACVKYVLHRSGLSDEKIENYAGLITIILEAAQSSAGITTRSGGIGFTGEDGLIKIILEGTERKLEYHDGHLLWEKNNLPGRKPGEQDLDEKYAGQLRSLLRYLENVSQMISNKDAREFSFPGTEEDVFRSNFIRERLKEVSGFDELAGQIVPVTYSGTTNRVAIFSVKQLILGSHRVHPYSDGENYKIDWPQTVVQKQRDWIADISQEMENADQVGRNMDELVAAGNVLENAQLDGIVRYAEKAIRDEAAKLGLADMAFDTAVTVTTKTRALRPSASFRDVETRYSLGQIALKGLDFRQAMKAPNSRLTSLVSILDTRDFQKEYEDHLKDARINGEIKNAFDLTILSKIKPIIGPDARLKSMKFSGYDLVGLFRYDPFDGKIMIFSVMDHAIQSFESTTDFDKKFRKDISVRRWVLGHSMDPSAIWTFERYGGYPAGLIFKINYYDDESLSNTFSFNPVDTSKFSIFYSYLDRLANEADYLAKSDSEFFWSNFLTWIEIIGFFVAVVTAPLGPLAGFAIGAATGTGPSFARALIADDPDEANLHLFAAALSLIFEAAVIGVPVGLGLFLKKLKSSASYRKYMSWVANTRLVKAIIKGVKFIMRWLDGDVIWRPEWVRNIELEFPVVKNARIDEKITQLEKLLNDDVLLKGQNSATVASGLDTIKKSPPSGLSTLTRTNFDEIINRNNAFLMRFRSINRWSRLSPESRTGHLVTIFEVDGVKYAIDPTPMSVKTGEVHRYPVMLEQAWFRKYNKEAGSDLVKYKDFDNLEEATHYKDSRVLMGVDKTERGTVLLRSPDWYEPDLEKFSRVDKSWKAEVDLDGVVPDADGIYRLNNAGTSSADAQQLYIRDLDGTGFAVKWDGDTLCVIRPDNPDGVSLPVRRRNDGRWMKHVDFFQRANAPVDVGQIRLEGKAVGPMIKSLRDGKTSANAQLDAVFEILKDVDNPTVATMGEFLWGSKWKDPWSRQALVEQLQRNLRVIQKRVRNFRPAEHTSFFNKKITWIAGDPVGRASFIIAELDPEKYLGVIKNGQKETYFNAYEDGINYIESRDDLGKEYLGRTVIHEMSHATSLDQKLVEISTVDNAYIKIRRPDKKHDLTQLGRLGLEGGAPAYNNADSYATFVQYVLRLNDDADLLLTFQKDFTLWKKNPDQDFLFDYNKGRIYPTNPVQMLKKETQHVIRNSFWTHRNDQQKIDSLVDYASASSQAKEFLNLVDRDVLENAIRNSLRFDFEGAPVKRFNWGNTYDLDLKKIDVRTGRDLLRYKEAAAHLDSLIKEPVQLTRTVETGETPLQAAANWVSGRRTSGTSSVDDLAEIMQEFESANLFDKSVIDTIRSRIYKPEPGQVYRSFRTADDPLFMSLDAAEHLFVRQLEKIPTNSQVAGDLLFATTVRIHPYGDGNGRVARMLYAMQWLRSNKSSFSGLTLADETLLSGLPSQLPVKPAAATDGRGEGAAGASAAGASADLAGTSGLQAGVASNGPELVAMPALGARHSTSKRAYDILDSDAEFEVGAATIRSGVTHISSWPAGQRPLDMPADDLVVSAGRLSMRNNALADSANSKTVKLIYYAPAVLRLLDPRLVLSVSNKNRSRKDPEDESGIREYQSGYKSSEFGVFKFDPELLPAGGPQPLPVFDYAATGHDQAATGAAAAGISEFVSTHYEADDVISQTMSLVRGRRGTGVIAADRLDYSAHTGVDTTLSIENILRDVGWTGVAYKRIHLCACRQVDGPAVLERSGDNTRTAADEWLQAADVGQEPPVSVGISHVVTLVSLDNERGTIEETVQGVIDKATGDYIGIDPAGGDNLVMPGFERVNWRMPDFHETPGDSVLDAVD